MENNVGKWDNWYKDLPETPGAFVYSDTITYSKAAEFLSDCKVVEDWGCGAGGFLNYRKDAICIDGSNSKHAHKKMIDLKSYINNVEGVHIRHVLEHNYEWKEILKNAVISAQKKLAITLFTPFSETETIELKHNKPYGVDVPDLSLSKKQFFDIIKSKNPKTIFVEYCDSNTSYSKECMIFIEF